MKIKLRNYRLVLACINFGAAIARLVAALVNMASNYLATNDSQMGKPVSA